MYYNCLSGQYNWRFFVDPFSVCGTAIHNSQNSGCSKRIVEERNISLVQLNRCLFEMYRKGQSLAFGQNWRTRIWEGRRCL